MGAQCTTALDTIARVGPSTKTQGWVSGQIRSEAVRRLIDKDTGSREPGT